MTRDRHTPQHPRIHCLPEAGAATWQELERAHRLIGALDDALHSHWERDILDLGSSQLARALSPFRCLVLACVGRQSAAGVRPVRLARLLRVRSSLLDYHLSILEKAGLIRRSSEGHHDGRRVIVRLTWAGGEALAASARVLAATLRGLAQELRDSS